MIITIISILSGLLSFIAALFTFKYYHSWIAAVFFSLTAGLLGAAFTYVLLKLLYYLLIPVLLFGVLYLVVYFIYFFFDWAVWNILYNIGGNDEE